MTLDELLAAFRAFLGTVPFAEYGVLLIHHGKAGLPDTTVTVTPPTMPFGPTPASA